jgi:hypothetical protein
MSQTPDSSDPEINEGTHDTVVFLREITVVVDVEFREADGVLLVKKQTYALAASGKFRPVGEPSVKPVKLAPPGSAR